jgi:DNA recombination protein RmuC
MATLTTVRAVLKDVRLREQAHLIRREMHALTDDIQRLDDRVAKLQKHFEQATDDVRQVRISTEKIGKRAERMEELQLGEPAAADVAAVEAAPGPEQRRLLQ